MPAAVTNVKGGKVRADTDEIVVGTYSGFVAGLSLGDAADVQVEARKKIDE
jgi:hypothetical protein